MKRTLYFIVAVFVFTATVMGAAFASSSIDSSLEMISGTYLKESSYDVNVVSIKKSGNAYIKKAISEKGKFNPETMTLTIEGGTYSVKENPYSDKTRGEYEYVANGIYFFNF